MFNDWYSTNQWLKSRKIWNFCRQWQKQVCYYNRGRSDTHFNSFLAKRRLASQNTDIKFCIVKVIASSNNLDVGNRGLNNSIKKHFKWKLSDKTTTNWWKRPWPRKILSWKKRKRQRWNKKTVQQKAKISFKIIRSPITPSPPPPKNEIHYD